MALSFVPTDDDTPIDPELAKWASPAQLKALQLVAENGGNVRVAEKALGLANDVLGHPIRRLRKLAASKGFSPPHGLTNPVPDPFTVTKVSTLRNRDGEITAQWIQAKPEAEQLLARLEAFRDGLMATLEPYAPIAPPSHCLDDLLTIYPIGDPHAGLYAWEEETGNKFDLEEFERVQCAAIDRLVASTPPSSLAILNDKGDSTHADNSKNRTPRSGHELDVHGRHAQVTRVALRVRRYQMARLLEKHERVIFRGDTGNHDSETALHLNLMMEMAYENEPRAEIITSPNPYWYYAFGRNLIGTCHGDGAKGKDLPLLMATDAPVLWGQTDFRVWIVGHVHHKDVKEYNGCVVEYIRTLAASDAHHHGAGYRSKRDLQAITLHRTDGEVERHTCSMARLDRLAA